jgi:hypothetical protein
MAISLADDDIKSGKMIGQCKSCTSKSRIKTWIETPDALRVAQNKKWKTAPNVAAHLFLALSIASCPFAVGRQQP